VPMNRRSLTAAVVFLAASALGCCGPAGEAKILSRSPVGPEVFFSPRGGCTEAIVRELAAARRVVRVQAYSFTSRPIAEALIAARSRGVDVAVILDRSQPTAVGGQAGRVASAGVVVKIDAAHAIAHNKVIVIDGRVVITGSFNFTQSAESRNAENLLILPDTVLARKYLANWCSHEKHSGPYQPH